MKERLIDLIDGFRELDAPQDGRSWTEHLTNHLLANGVIVPPVKVGQTVWFLRKGEIGKGTIVNMVIEINKKVTYAFDVLTEDKKKLVFCDFDIDETVFDREGKAEQALAERSEK